MIKLNYNFTTTQFLNYDDGGMPIVQGDDGYKEFHIYFDDASVVGSYGCRVVIERPDGATSNEIYATPITGIGGGYFKLKVSSWIAEVSGVLKITVRLRNTETIVFGLANIPVQDGVDPDENETISDTQYEAIQTAVDGVLDGSTPVFFDNTGTDLDSNSQQDAIVEVNQKINNVKDGTDAFSEITLGTPPNVVTIRYIHTNGNNFQVVSITYPDGREANIDEEMYVNFRNESGATRDSGIFLMTDGLSTGNQAVKGILFNPTSQHARKFLGVVTVDGVGVNQKSKATRFGIVHGIPTTRFRTTGTAYAEGQYLWATADGLLSNVAPTKPALQINVGIIINLQGGNADILVCPIVYGAFGDSSDVIITTPTNGDIPILGSDGVWRNSQRLVVAESEIAKIKDGTTIVKKAEQDTSGNVITSTYETKADATSKKSELDGEILALDGRVEDLETANMIKSYTYNPSTHVLTFTYYDNSTTSFDLPLESAIVDASYDNVTKDITFTLQSGATLVVPLDDLISGLASETWVTTYFIPKTAIKTSFSATPLDTNVISEKLAKDTFDTKEALANKATDFSVVNDTKYPTTKAVAERLLNLPIAELEARTTVLESKIDVVGLDYKEYGIREVVGQSASDFERVTRFGGEIKLGSATGLVANVAIDDADATNSFDYIPIFKREKVSIDATDLSSNIVSNTFVKVPKFYIKEEWTTEGGIDYHYIFMSQFKHEGYRLPLPFRKQDGSERDYTYIGAYEAYLDGNNKLRSLTGQIPKVSYSRNNFRNAARALDGLGVNSKYQITDLAEYVDLVQIPFMIEFATKHSQGVFLGATSMAYSASHTAIADGTGVNDIVVSNATGANFVLGQTVSIGTSNSNDSIAKDRIVTQIQVDTPNAGETTITFDGAAVNIAIGNVVASRAWKTGMTDNVKVSGSHALNDGKHSIVWRGLENPFGNIWKNVDGVKISNWRGYVTENPKDYNDTASVAGVYAEPYLPLGYLNANANNYAQDLGYDANYPYAKFPISVQASSGLFFRDYYYQNSGDRTVFFGGYWDYSSYAGLFSWALGGDLGSASFILGARLSYRP